MSEEQLLFYLDGLIYPCSVVQEITICQCRAVSLRNSCKSQLESANALWLMLPSAEHLELHTENTLGGRMEQFKTTKAEML